MSCRFRGNNEAGSLVGRGYTPQLYVGLQDQCVAITEESKALLEGYNKTVSFVLRAP